MEYVKAVIGDMEMYVPVNDRLGKLILLANRRLNFQKLMAKMRKGYQGKIEGKIVIIDSAFIYELEDVMEEKGYSNVIHHQIESCDIEQGKILYDLLRLDKTIHYLTNVYGYEQEQLQKVIRNFFEALKKIIF